MWNFLGMLDLYEGYHVTSWREVALDRLYEHICADDTFTDGISIGPVSTLKYLRSSLYFWPSQYISPSAHLVHFTIGPVITLHSVTLRTHR